MTHLRTAFFADFGQLEATQKNFIVGSVWFLTRLGNEAVIVFFVLSGYFVAGKGISRLLNGSFDLAGYSRDRIARIYTPYIPALIVSAVCALLIHEHVSASQVLLNLIGLQGLFTSSFAGNAPLWSLAYEIWFYILLASVAGAFGSASQSKLTRTISLVFLIASLAVFTVLNPTYLFCWILGGIAYFIPRGEFKVSKLIASFGLVTISVIGTQLLTTSSSFNPGSIGRYLPPIATIQLILACAVILVILNLPPRPESVVGQTIERGGTKLAGWSYTLYLVHYPILSVMQFTIGAKATRIDSVSVSRCLTGAVVVLVIAFVLYWLFERNTAIVRSFLDRKFNKKQLKQVHKLEKIVN